MNSSNKSFLLLVLQLLVINVLSFFPSSYPYYCSKDIAARSIPVLTATEQSEVTQIQQLQIMMRHGARTPYSLYSCWNDYTVTWNNCNVTTLMLASPSYTSLQRPSPWLFRKLFDGSANYLGGNCLTGQLILEGYLQQEQNGNHLYNAYIDSPINSMKLFNTDVWDEIDTENLIYLRSDNEERTLLSGQVMMHSMFNVRNILCYSYY